MMLVPACAFLALVLNDHNVSDSYFACFQSFLWALSIYLEVSGACTGRYDSLQDYHDV